MLKTSPPDPPSKTIGILTARLSGPNEINLWHGVAERARERRVNLVFFSGGIPNWTQLFEAQRNVLFKIAGKENVDGLLVWANILNHTLDRTGLKEFCEYYSPLPIISMGMVLPATESIRIDMRAGMRKLLAHLVEQHGRRRIAFIRGPQVSQDAEERYAVYLETLKHYDLPFDPRLVVAGDFRRYSGTAGIQQLMDTAGLGFDAVVSANDNMAIGALQALQERGVRVPADVLVAGFDDIEETRAVMPSLTTIRAPWHELGTRSIDLLLNKMEGKPVPGQILLETELVCRQSCGCQQAMVELRSSGSAGQPRQDAAAHLQASLAPVHWLEGALREKLANAFLHDLAGKPGSPRKFIPLLRQALEQGGSGIEVLEWQNVLGLFWSGAQGLCETPGQAKEAAALVLNGMALAGETAHRRQLAERIEAASQTSRLNRIVQTMSTTHDIEKLMSLLAAELPRLGIHSCYLSLYDEKGENPAWCRLVLAMRRDERLPLPAGGVRFPTRQLVPPSLLPQGGQVLLDVEALHFQDQPIGFVIFEIGPPDGEVYTALQGHISSALKSAELVQVALEAEAKAKKSDQLKTYLLANVSHELRTPLNIILGLSQTALSSPNPYGMEFPGELTKDLGYIYDSGEHLIRLINDLLDTSRAEIGELDLCLEPVLPVELLQEAFEAFAHTPALREKKVELALDVPDSLPVLKADPVRLRQVFMNLLSNAFKFTESGRIVLGGEVQFPHVHFWVADTGMGITPELQERIFEPFVKADPPGRRREGIGLGLSITRRLVALHGGTITLESQPGAGSTFHVYMPLPSLDQSPPALVEPAQGKPLLLWLSGTAEAPETVLSLCRNNGMTPFRLAGAEDLGRSLSAGRPAALAWDLENAGTGDGRLMLQLRSQAPFCQVPLLIFHGGGEAESGARMTSILPKPVGKQVLRQVLNLLPEDAEQGEIWIIDDDPQALKYFHELIGASMPGTLVRPIQGGLEALRLLEEAAPALVILDLMMPGMDGFEVLEHLRRNLRTAQVPVIIMTGKLLSYEDIQRLDSPRVLLQSKGIFTGEENLAGIRRMLEGSLLPQPTAALARKAVAFIQQNYSRAFSLDELAEKVGASKSYLSRIFKSDTGISAWDYLNRFRIQKAQELLLLTDQSITEIAAAAGFEDAGYFGRVFRQVSGCSPRDYRKTGIPPGRVDASGQ